MDQAVFDFHPVIREICELDWEELDETQLSAAAWAYYYFSIQFRESLILALQLHPQDEELHHLSREECDTDNLSPWPGVAKPGERLNHDEFMRRLLQLTAIDAQTQVNIQSAGERYLEAIDLQPAEVRAMSIASYEDGGLECVFKAMLRAKYWNTPLLEAFRHFLVKHIEFDSDPETGHGALARHLRVDSSIHPVWAAFRDLILTAVPRLGMAGSRDRHVQ